jgi:hypothetical protein
VLLAEVGEYDGQLGPELIAHHAGDADPAGLSEPFEPRRDIDRVAKQILALDNDVADMYSNAEAHLVF